MNYQEIIRDALNKVISEHGYQGAVRNRDIHEQALAHRLAVHLENTGFFGGYSVDCEYNRHGDVIKTDADGNRFRPDIVIHTRGNDENNLIMVESKKFNDSQQEIDTAKQDLGRRKNEYGYRHGFLVIFPEVAVQENSVVEI